MTVSRSTSGELEYDKWNIALAGTSKGVDSSFEEERKAGELRATNNEQRAT